jgi:hypothetical protein
VRLAGTKFENTMKSWNGLEEDATAPVKTRRIRIWWRVLSATFVTLVCLAAVDTILPGLKSWDPSFLNKEPAPRYASFEWSEVRGVCVLSVALLTWFCPTAFRFIRSNNIICWSPTADEHHLLEMPRVQSRAYWTFLCSQLARWKTLISLVACICDILSSA